LQRRRQCDFLLRQLRQSSLNDLSKLQQQRYWNRKGAKNAKKREIEPQMALPTLRVGRAQRK
jgi:outer membrane PBP1 activator LpoA protein